MSGFDNYAPVHLDASASTDPNEKPLSFARDFHGDGSFDGLGFVNVEASGEVRNIPLRPDFCRHRGETP